LSYIFLSQPAADYLGRRWAVFLGAMIVCVGAAFQAGATVLAMMVIGRILCGACVAIVSSTVAIYQRYTQIFKLAK
jgi:MFS family permease